MSVAKLVSEIKASSNPTDPVSPELQLVVELLKVMSGQTSTLIDNFLARAVATGDTAAADFLTSIKSKASTVSEGSNIGTGPNQLVQLDGSSKLPPVDGSQLTNVSGSGGASLPIHLDTQTSGTLPGSQLPTFTGDVTNSAAAMALAATAVSPGAYTSANITVDSKGRITSAANGTGTTGSAIGQIFNPTTSTGNLFEDFDAFQYAVGTPQGPMNLLMNVVGSATAVKDAPTSSETNRFGIVKFTGSSTGSSGFYTDLTPMYAGGGTFTVALAVQLGSNVPSGAGNSWVGTWGAGNSWPSNPNGAYFQMTKDAPNFQCVTYDGAVNTTTDSGIPYVANTWYNFRVVSGPTSALFYIDGVLVATNTTHLPIGAYGNTFLACTNQTGAGFSTRVDWVESKFTPTVARGSDLLTTGGSGMIQSLAGHIVSPTTYTYVLDESAAFGYNINSFKARLSAGTIVGAIQINGTNVTGLSAMSLTTTPSTNSASGLNVVAVGNRVTLVTSSPVSAADLTYTLSHTRS